LNLRETACRELRAQETRVRHSAENWLSRASRRAGKQVRESRHARAFFQFAGARDFIPRRRRRRGKGITFGVTIGLEPARKLVSPAERNRKSSFRDDCMSWAARVRSFIHLLISGRIWRRGGVAMHSSTRPLDLLRSLLFTRPRSSSPRSSLAIPSFAEQLQSRRGAVFNGVQGASNAMPWARIPKLERGASQMCARASWVAEISNGFRLMNS